MREKLGLENSWKKRKGGRKKEYNRKIFDSTKDPINVSRDLAEYRELNVSDQ